MNHFAIGPTPPKKPSSLLQCKLTLNRKCDAKVQLEHSLANLIFTCSFISFIHSVKVAFWSLFGRVQLADFRTSQGFSIITGSSLVFFGLFNVLAVLVAINMLIAMLNESFSHYAVSTKHLFLMLNLN